MAGLTLILGVGASAMLKAVVQRYRSSWSGAGATRKVAGSLDKIIHIDCSLWQSKRSLQKAVAEELKLSQEVMAFFDQVDEEEDFDGVHQVARGVIPEVKLAIFNVLSNCKFLVVFHNGSGNYVDLWECGVPVMGVMGNRVLWTSQGRLFHGLEGVTLEERAGLSDVAILVFLRNIYNIAHVMDISRHVFHADADEVAWYSGVPESKIVLECILYKLLLTLTHREANNIEWGTHAANYWVCDGIIQDMNGCGTSAWEIGDALHRNMNLDWSEHTTDMMRLVLYDQLVLYNNQLERHSTSSQDAQVVQVMRSSFLKGAKIHGGTFKHFDTSRLRVLHLSHSAFSFSSPPFLRCSNVRFLLLDHCKDNNNAPDHGEEQDCSQGSDGECFQKLWVLELNYTNWYWLLSRKALDLMAELRELHVKGPGKWILSHLHSSTSAEGSNGRKLLKLRVVGGPNDSDNNIDDTGGHVNQQASSFPNLSSWHNLKTVLLDGCVELKEISGNTMPPSLESFSFTSHVPTKIKSISFHGCAILKSLLLRGVFGELVELDMSTTSVKTLDLSEMQATSVKTIDLNEMEALHLRRVFLLGCQKLHAILWPQKSEILEVLRIDTTHATWAREDMSNREETASDCTSGKPSSAAVHGNIQALTNLDSYISLRDPRLFRSLQPTRFIKKLHVEIWSTGGHKGANQGINSSQREVRAVNLQNAAGNLYVNDTISGLHDNSQTTCTKEGDVLDAPAVMWMWACPFIPMDSDSAYCYIRIQHERPTKSLQVKTAGSKQETSTTLPIFIQKDAITLHLHDYLSITCIPGPEPADPTDLEWHSLRWCRLERCPNLEGSVFTAPLLSLQGRDNIFASLKTFWASQLLKASYIWNWKSVFLPGYNSFSELVFLHLDHCPRLVYVLPLYKSNGEGCHRLETLDIVCCGELREVFPSDSESLQQKPRVFPELRRINLYELPKLQRVCGQRMLAPRLVTLKIRGCWSLKRLPAVRHAPHRSTSAHTLPTVDCEKELWDSLEWDGEEAGHQPSHYKTTHSGYYKKTLLRASVLR